MNVNGSIPRFSIVCKHTEMTCISKTKHAENLPHWMRWRWIRVPEEMDAYDPRNETGEATTLRQHHSL